MLGADLTYDAPLYRPPSEGQNLIVQATLGCSFNRCSFCSMYRSKTFQARPLEAVFADIERAAALWPEAHRVFLADGDAMMLPSDHLCRILDQLAESFPELQRVSSYALPANLIKKTPEELGRLRERRLSLLYYGIETGSHDLMKRITKGASPAAMIEGIGKARAAGIKVSAMVILGLGGRRHWQGHIDETVDLVNRVPLNFLSTLELTLDPVVEAEFHRKFGEPFEFQDTAGILAEQARLIAGLAPPAPLIFRSNHASNALPLAGTLPKDRDKLLAMVGGAAEGMVPLRAYRHRGY